ncbi:MAG: hypothetical protein JNM63_07505, partial [Spirochaetia bacterium]|nr:hypothetical protein [Spirochaetia bacterium]
MKPFLVVSALILTTAFSQNLKEIPDSEELRLAPGFTVDCTVQWDKALPSQEEIIVKKDKEYLLRVSGHEDGKITFFVYLDGWEPRLRGPAPVPGKPYHIIATWTGTEMILEVNGERSSAPRTGRAFSGKLPISAGPESGRMEGLQFANPNLSRAKALAAFSEKARTSDPISQNHFGGKDGWKGWQIATGDSPVEKSSALIANLWLDLSKKNMLTVEAGSQAQDLLLFLTSEKGFRTEVISLKGEGRSTAVDLSRILGKEAHLTSLALSPIHPGDGEINLKHVWFSEKDEGSPFLHVQSLSPAGFPLRVGREEELIAVIKNLGTAASNIRISFKGTP